MILPGGMGVRRLSRRKCASRPGRRGFSLCLHERERTICSGMGRRRHARSLLRFDKAEAAHRSACALPNESLDELSCLICTLQIRRQKAFSCVPETGGYDAHSSSLDEVLRSGKSVEESSGHRTAQRAHCPLKALMSECERRWSAERICTDCTYNASRASCPRRWQTEQPPHALSPPEPACVRTPSQS